MALSPLSLRATTRGILRFGSLIAAIGFLLSGATVSAQGSLTCSPAQQTASVGQTVTFRADGGSDSYVWATPSTVSSNSGSTFSTSFNESGPNTVIVQSGGQEALCTVNVTGTSVGGSVYQPPMAQVPGLPYTGGGGGVSSVSPVFVLFGALVLAGMTFLAISGVRMVLAS